MQVLMLVKNFHGLVQRLVLKEKQVLQLQAEVDRFKAQNPNEGRDAVCPCQSGGQFGLQRFALRMSVPSETATVPNGIP
jgi:hypothetical protein